MEEIENTWPNVSKNEKVEIDKVLKSNRLNYWTGNYCKIFEKNFRKFFKRKYALTVNSGSVALDIALKSLNLKIGSEVIVTPRSYIASASCVLNNNLKPVFSDISLESQNIELNFLKKKITKNTRAIIVVHLAGMPADVPKIINFARKKKIKVIEDCSQAHGAKIGKDYVGSFGDIAIWSFCNDKIMNTLGEGGMLCTNNKKIYQNAWSLRDCGKNIDKVKRIDKKNFEFKWLHDFNGSNYRMTEIQAAVGNLQLKKLKYWIKKRNNYAQRLENTLKKYNFISTFKKKKNYLHAYYRFYVFVNTHFLRKKWDVERIIKELNKRKVYCNYGACPQIYKEKIFLKEGYKVYLKNAEKLRNKTISFIIHPNLKYDYIQNFKKVIELIFRKASIKNVK